MKRNREKSFERTPLTNFQRKATFYRLWSIKNAQHEKLSRITDEIIATTHYYSLKYDNIHKMNPDELL